MRHLVVGGKLAKNVSQSNERIRWERDNKDKENYKHSLDFQKISREDMGVSDISPCYEKSPEKKKNNNAKKKISFSSHSWGEHWPGATEDQIPSLPLAQQVR